MNNQTAVMSQVDFTKLRQNIQQAMPYYSLSPDGTRTSLTDAGEDHLQAFMEEAKKDEIVGNKIAPKTLDSAAWALLKELALSGDLSDNAVAGQIKNLFASLRTQVKQWRAYAPVQGLVVVALRGLRVGRVVFHSSPQLKLRLKRRVRGVAASQVADVPYRRKTRLFESHMDDAFGECPSIAEVILEAEQAALSDIVERDVESALDLLRCFTGILQDTQLAPSIGIGGSLGTRLRHVLAFADSGSNAFIGASVADGYGQYLVDRDRLNYLRSKCAFGSLSAILAKADHEMLQMERILATAVRWAAHGVAAKDAPDKIISFCVALEQMMTAGERGELTERLAMRLAFLLAHDRESRSRLYTRAKHLYGLRSTIVHTGRATVAKRDADELENITVAAIVALARDVREWQTHNDFARWVRERQLS